MPSQGSLGEGGRHTEKVTWRQDGLGLEGAGPEDYGAVAISRGVPATAGSWKRQGTHSLLETPKGTWPSRHLYRRPLPPPGKKLRRGAEGRGTRTGKEKRVPWKPELSTPEPCSPEKSPSRQGKPQQLA